jgi:maltose O-acetyltransferase
MKKISSYLLFLLLNQIDLQYVVGLSSLNNYISRFRMVFLRACGASVGSNTVIRARATIVNPRNLVIGENCTIGRNCNLMNFATVCIGNDVEIGPDCVFQTNEHVVETFDKPLGQQGATYQEIKIGDGCYVGANVTFLSGVQISSQIMIGAKSLVNKDLSDKGLYGGVPCRLKKVY